LPIRCRAFERGLSDFKIIREGILVGMVRNKFGEASKDIRYIINEILDQNGKELPFCPDDLREIKGTQLGIRKGS
jgi:hypothetical protein